MVSGAITVPCRLSAPRDCRAKIAQHAQKPRPEQRTGQTNRRDCEKRLRLWSADRSTYIVLQTFPFAFTNATAPPAHTRPAHSSDRLFDRALCTAPDGLRRPMRTAIPTSTSTITNTKAAESPTMRVQRRVHVGLRQLRPVYLQSWVRPLLQYLAWRREYMLV